jgi:hypothetical protein
VRRFKDIHIEVVIQEDGTSYGGHTDRFLSDFEEVDGLCHQAVGDPVMAPGAEMERNVDQAFGPFKNLFHHFLPLTVAWAWVLVRFLARGSILP